MAGAPDLRSLCQGARLSERLSERMAGDDRKPSRRGLWIHQQISELGGGRPRKMGIAWLCLRARRLARYRKIAGLCRSFLAARDARFLRVHRMGWRAGLVE